MHTLPHNDNLNGYSIRIGKNLPENAANLAYVHTDSPAPQKNLSVINYANDIPENREKDPFITKNLYISSLADTDIFFEGQISLTNLLPIKEIHLSRFQTTLTQTIPLIKNHIYYVRRDYEINKGEWNNQSGRIRTKTGELILVDHLVKSKYFKFTGTTNLNTEIDLFGNFVPNKLGEQDAIFKNIIIVDLTEAYGIGKEPNKEFMDNLTESKKYFEKVSYTTESQFQQEAPQVYSDILMKDGQPFVVPSENILLTNQFSYDKYKHPLYYIHSLSKEVNLGNQEVYLYISGNRVGSKTTYNKIQENQFFVLNKDYLTVTKNDYENLSYNEHYKVIGIPTGKTNIARLYLISNFQNNEKDTYSVEYNAFDDNKNQHTKETINASSLFLEDIGMAIHSKTINSYKLVPVNQNKNNQIESYNNQGFYIQLLAEDLDKESEINAFNRNPYTFEYQVDIELESRFSEQNPVDVNIGYIYINDTVFNALPLTSAMRKLVSGGLFPEYINFVNPHHSSGSPYPESVDYWLANLEMPEEHYLDYDILIITGYGDKDLTHYIGNIKSFLAGGGLLFIDNNSTNNSLQFYSNEDMQTFLIDFDFDRQQTNPNRIQYKENKFNDRFYNHPSLENVGLNFARINFRNDELEDDWTHLIESDNGQPALTFRHYENGKVFLSNLGLMTQIMLGEKNPHYILVNLFIYYLEHRSFKSPVLKDHVLHHSDLFEEDYHGYYGENIYFNDVSDQDNTQIVAKKALGDSTAEAMNKYLPQAYKQPIQAKYRVNIKDTILYPMENADFEKLVSQTTFTDTKENALPGYRYIVQSKGNKSNAGISSSIYYQGSQSVYVDFEGTRAYFEKELIDLPAGNYKLEAYVRTENTNAGGFAIYGSDLNPIALNESLEGTSTWKTHTLYFTLEETQTVYLRLGSSDKIMNGIIYFDNLTLVNEGNIRMTPENSGELELYAYALEARGQNYLLNHNSDFNLIRSDIQIEPIIRIRSFVYEWNSQTQQYQKHYGKNAYVKANLLYSEGEKVIAKLIDVIPSNEAGYQWSYAQNIFYQIEVDPGDPFYHYVNLSIYNPVTNDYFYSNNGQWIINREDLWTNNVESHVQLRAQSLVDNMKITSSKYTLIELNNQQITLEGPNTTKESNRWYPRIKNGSFNRELLSQSDMIELDKVGLGNYNEEYIVGKHQYNLPEYHQQSFYPRKGERLVEAELANYINPHTIQLQKYPIVVKEQYMETPLYNFEGDKKTFRSLDTFWDSRFPVKVYWDEQQKYDGYDINFEEGSIIFSTEVPENVQVRAHYQQNNVRIYRRKLSNYQIEKEQLTFVDDNSLRFSQENIATSPNPILYRDNEIISPNEYWIDFEKGLVHFYQTNRKNIYASYLYYIYEELTHTNINAIKGEISLAEDIHFLDEIVVDYIYEEKHLEYKGYYNAEDNIFMHLDLNPTAGHTFTHKAYTETGDFSHYYEESSEKLLNKTLYFYLLPQHSQFIDKSLEENNTVRHCFDESEWLYIKSTYPEAILLGTIFVRENTNLNNITMLDARRPGGGLKENISDKVIQNKLGYASALWDIGSFDGLSYYKNGVTIIQIPNHILKVNGGLFSEEDVRKTIDKYLALGVYPIIEYIDVYRNNPITDIAGDAIPTSLLDSEETITVDDLNIQSNTALDVSRIIDIREE